MKHNFKAGLLSVAVALALCGSAFWGWSAFDAHKQAQLSEEALGKTLATVQRADRDSVTDDYARAEMDVRDKQRTRETMSIQIGLVGDLAVVLVALAGLWNCRGFRRD